MKSLSDHVGHVERMASLTASEACNQIARELSGISADASDRSQVVAGFVLETVLVHEAAAQQLYVS